MSGENINRRLNIYINDREVVNSMRGVTSEMAKVRNQIKNLNEGAEDYNEKLQLLKNTYARLTQEQARFKADLAETPSILQRVKGALGPVASGMLAAFSVGSLVSGFMGALGNAKKVIFDFEQAIADLSAITGASGKDLDFLKKSAISLGEETKGGAVAVVEAYKLIASAKPELLDNVSALNQVTEATLLLAKASGMELPEAATSLTDAMNQFGVDANQASVFVDALANGAKYGAAEIPQVTESLLKFGAVARSSNIDIKQSTALVELLAENGLKGAEAGTALRNVLLKLSATDALPKEAKAEFEKLGISLEFLRDKSIPIQEKLEALKPLLKDNASIVKIFGTENATAAINVLAHTDRLKDLTSKMGEVGAAQEQAAIKMNTVNGKTDLLISKYDSLILSIGEGSGVVSGFFKFFIDGASNALTGLTRLNNSWDELHSKAKMEGQKDGVNSFTQRFNFLAGTGNDAEIAKSIKTPALQTYKKLMQELKKNEEDVKKYEGDSAFLGFGEGHFSKLANEKKEALLKEINIQVAIIREANKKIDEFKNPKNKTKTDTTTTGGTPSENDESAAKKREKELADAKKHSDDLLKQLEVSKKELLATERSFEDLKLANQKDGYVKELALLNEEYDRKKEDTKIKVVELQKEIDGLTKDAADPKNSKSDIAVIKKTIANKIAAQKEYSDTLVAIEETRTIKIGALQEKYLQKEIQSQEKEKARELQNLQTRHNNELASITSLEEAKAALSTYLSDEELAKVTTLEGAKKKLKQEYQKEELKLQQEHLLDMMAQMQAILNNQNTSGIELISPEERAALLVFMDELAAKYAALGITLSSGEENADPKQKKFSSGVDILGFSPEDWQIAFDGLDNFSLKMEAMQMGVTALQNAFGMYFQFLEAGERRSLQKFESANNKRKAALADQLDKGYIGQEVYNARVAKLDQELAKRRAEGEYKQAKRQKAMQAAQIISSTALAIMGIWRDFPKVDFGASAAIMSGVVGALGAAQLATVLAQPLPDKNGFYDGGYTGSGPERNSPGPVHYDEYVVPKKVLFGNDPVVPNIVGYLEAKRLGKDTSLKDYSTDRVASEANGVGSANVVDAAVANSLNRISAVLEKIEEKGLEAFLVNDFANAKKIRDKIKEFNKIESKAKV